MTRKTVPASASGAAGYHVFYGYNARDLPVYARFGSSSSSSKGITNGYDGYGRATYSSNNMGPAARTLNYRTIRAAAAPG